MEEYARVNLANWDERASAHAASPGYEVARLITGERELSHVVAFDVPRLGDIAGLEAVHVQCHIGTDTLSLARLGAHMTGVDFSPAALGEARRIAADAGEEIEYVQSEVYEAPQALEGRTFDLVYTGIGAICWLPDIARWAHVVRSLLRDGGRLFIREGHPMLWAIDETYGEKDGLLVIDYPYFETAEPMIFDEGGTYVPTDVEFTSNRTVNWNHGLGEIVTALLAEGMRITELVEHDSGPWDPLPGLTEEFGDREFHLTERRSRVPFTYTLQAVVDS